PSAEPAHPTGGGAQAEPAPPAAERPAPAPDIAENDGVANIPKPKPQPRKPSTRNRRHGRRR
ncbi:MAG TPA: hypothetical protein VG186_14430, partial [Solirubrobacteraceae bacterium]|nr:hypothetical protein [Solirubrobacteraceae bacterium]